MLTSEKRNTILNRAPLVLKAISGFTSSVTVTVNSLIFLWTTYILVIDLHGGWPSTTKLFIMFVGPIVTSLHFVNSVSVLSTLFANTDKNTQEAIDSLKDKVVGGDDVSLERTLFGDLAVLLRASAGFITVVGICLGSLLFTYTIHMNVINEGSFPPDRTLALVVIGPIITSWTFMKANTTLKQLLESNKIKEFLKGKLKNYLEEKPTK